MNVSDEGAGSSGTEATSGSEAPHVLPVVGLGASAGGLEAMRQLFACLPTDTGMAFVVIQHLDPDHPSMLTDVLRGVTEMPVVEAASGMRVEPDRVHVIPSGSDLAIHRAILTLVPRQLTGKLHLPIDSFFRALAEDQHRGAIGVVLSGSGADGTEGLRAIQAEGGIAIAQSPESAQFPSMPESALAAGVVDFCSPPREIAKEVTRLSRHPYVADAAAPGRHAAEERAAQEATLASVLALVQSREGVHFGGYKQTTVLRRIERRMALRRVRTLVEYASVLHDDPGEARSLAQDMLIHVTSFFRDPDAFETLKQCVLEPIVKHKADGDTIRIWVPGCSTGQEAYAVAICLLESIDGPTDRFAIKVFGSDLSDEAIDTARLGLYPESALAEVSPERLSRFFDRAHGGYRIGKPIRDMCVFVKHDLTRDPPFAKLDLISCRNVLIYFDAELQRRILPMLHHCLDQPGYLFLGQSEAIIGFRNLFVPLEKENRIFLKTGRSPRIAYPLAARLEAGLRRPPGAPVERQHPAREALRHADHLLLTRFAPPGVVVNDRLEIIQFRGRTGAFLEAPPGQPEASVLRMARGALAAHLHDALERAKAQSITVRAEKLTLQTDTGTRVVNLEVVPLTGDTDCPERFFLILFEEMTPRTGAETAPLSDLPEPAAHADELGRLTAELVATKDYLRSIILEHESTADELATTSEEMIAANEELQSTNEELQSAKEELQSTNEELSTVNDELRDRNADLDQIANDLANVLASIEIPVIIVDLELRVRRFTPAVRDIAGFIPSDLGRPIDDLKLKVDVGDLNERISEVIGVAALKEWEVKGHDDHWYRLQIRPYRTADGRPDGAVLSFLDIDTLKRALRDAEGSRDYARSIVDTVTTALVVLDARLRVLSANHAFYERFGLSPDDAERKSVFDVGQGMLDDPVVRGALAQALSNHARFSGIELKRELPGVGRKIMSLTGRPMLWDGGAPMILLAVDDITGVRALEAERAELLESETLARRDAQQANRTKDLFLATLSHELRTPLSTLLMQSQILKRMAAGDQRLEKASGAIERAATAQAKLVEDLLDVSRILSGKLLLDLHVVDLVDIVRAAVEVARPSAQAKSLELDVTIDAAVGAIRGDAARLQQVVANLLTNAIKFTPAGGRVTLRLAQADGRARITVADTGMGIHPDVVPQVFARFVQADNTVTRVHGGLGLGLAIVRHLVELHGGEVHAESPGEGKGSTFRVTLPLGDVAALPVRNVPRPIARDIGRIRVLLIEDEEDVREAFSTMLEQLGAVVRAVSSAADGLAAIDAFGPEVVLCDIAMPGEDGYSFIRKMRERAKWIPAAALTALASDEDRARAIEAGFQMHIAKPVDTERLAAAVGMLAEWKPGATTGEQIPS
jgi:two-component system, chemotaxis family, CheB/CheR fusion protein